ncbi:MAG: 3-hydroxybutyryl-CoA dehydrogenase [Chloroflexi bacterium]|nr:3-hydroxybutyryl-CoA dehydrogenase [Ardenticatenaceae bacterium]MBL1127126.1 3-hydroxybutyryl-CoA dehydrogenase [Chloroflexota bacterium]NOG33185.1 3-hydroxybutyryl-CoA dehydrogenase [Chloroflexota bacterium]
MGAGIAQVSALAGYQVVLYDISEDVLHKALTGIQVSIDQGVARGKIAAEAAKTAKVALTLTTSLAEAAPVDLVIEAAPETIDLKRQIFDELESLAPAHTIFASNTSSLSINVLASATQRQDRFLGLHFFNPAQVMKLVEVIRGDFTSETTLAAALAYVARLGKTAVLCKDTPAFIVNRVARPFYGEAFRLLGENAADHTTIDKLLKSLGFRMGPFELIDLIGCDVNFAVTQSVYEVTFHDPKYRPHPIQQRMVESGRLGRKTGHGFYEYKE